MMLLRSVNVETPLNSTEVPERLVSVEYRGDPVVGALVVGQADLRWDNPNQNEAFACEVQVRRLGTYPVGYLSEMLEATGSVFIRRSYPVVADLVDGDVIDCFLSTPGSLGCVLLANGFAVAIH